MFAELQSRRKADTDALAEIPYVDPERMGSMGWSYGGYMMMWFEGHTDRFAASASMMGGVGGTVTLLQAMADHGIRNIVYSSSATVYGLSDDLPYAEDAPTSAINPYGRTKLYIEEILRDLQRAGAAQTQHQLDRLAGVAVPVGVAGALALRVVPRPDREQARELPL